jgi:hypothetical protein
MAASYDGQIYTSIDSGTTWTLADAPMAAWEGAACSADGASLIALANGIYLSKSISAPSLNINPAGSNLLVSWLVPSANFVLQQNPDLVATHWTDVMISPALNLIALQNEVSVPLTGSNIFYRLKTP